MRLLFLIPDLRRGRTARASAWLRLRVNQPHFHLRRTLWTTDVFGGTLNLMRYCHLARSLGIEAFLATLSGRDTYGTLGIGPLPYVPWAARQRDDVCVVPDIYSHLADDVAGEVIVYQQSPALVRSDFDHRRANLQLLSCSPLVTERCRQVLPDKEPVFLPCMVDPRLFPFVAQERRRAGSLVALPRKSCRAFIEDVYSRYRAGGGRYWTLELLEDLSFHDYAARCRTPQALLTASDVEGFGLPGAEAMAAGIVVAGKNGGGGSFYMRDDETALVANSAERAAEALREIEDPGLRQRLSRAGYESVRPFFPDGEPLRFWKAWLAARSRLGPSGCDHVRVSRS